MSSALPSPSDDYKAAPDLRINRAVWDAVFGSIGGRLRLLEAVRADFDALISLGTGQALASIAANIEPEMVAARAALAQLRTDVAAAEDVIAVIANGSVPITSVSGLASALAGKATPADVAAAIDALKGNAPAAYDTLVEIATRLDTDASSLATILAGITPAAILAKLATVDGSGSGLDADLVHGSTPSTLGLAVLAAASQAAGRTALGLGDAALLAVGTAAGQAVVRNAAGTIDGLAATTEFTASGTWTKPTSLSASALAIVALSGGGGGGGAGGNGYSGGGGGGGGGLLWIGPASLLPASAAVTIGAGGAGGTATAAGASGGTTSFGALFAASGGSPGGQQSSVTVAGGGPGGVGTSTLAGGLGSAGVASTVKLSGATSVAGGAGAGGGAGGAASSTTVGGAGGLGGGGGGGGSNASSASGGAGGAGHCRVTIIG